MTLNANMNGLHDFLAELHEKNEVVWITYPFGLEGLYITYPASTEHMLKINFPNYPKVVLKLQSKIMGGALKKNKKMNDLCYRFGHAEVRDRWKKTLRRLKRRSSPRVLFCPDDVREEQHPGADQL
ncbi:hypothetical protein R1flu_007006 [Riccia fluitans]|uniref:Uncharacterized protein n=1 Tax=Riccia fluitans TaxID=41844 RepID=A0ABD1Z1R2_9MARC